MTFLCPISQWILWLSWISNAATISWTISGITISATTATVLNFERRVSFDLVAFFIKATSFSGVDSDGSLMSTTVRIVVGVVAFAEATLLINANVSGDTEVSCFVAIAAVVIWATFWRAAWGLLLVNGSTIWDSLYLELLIDFEFSLSLSDFMRFETFVDKTGRFTITITTASWFSENIWLDFLSLNRLLNKLLLLNWSSSLGKLLLDWVGVVLRGSKGKGYESGDGQKFYDLSHWSILFLLGITSCIWRRLSFLIMLSLNLSFLS